MREVLHLVQVSDVLVMTTVRVDQPLLLLNFSSLYIFVNIDVALIS